VIRRVATFEQRQRKIQMANTFSSLHYHIVFSTKDREPWLNEDMESRVWAFIGGIARENGFKALQIGGRPDHIHVLIGLPPSASVSKAVQLIKGGSSKWIKDQLPNKKRFAWQDGYGAFTVSKSTIGELTDYIRSQKEHHRVKTFQEEYIAFLKRHEIEYDQRYVWG
jgi:putative transposase